MKTLFDTDPTKVKKTNQVKVDKSKSYKPLPKEYNHGCIKETLEEFSKATKLQTQFSNLGSAVIFCPDDKTAEKALQEFNVLYVKNLNKYIEKQNDDPKKYSKSMTSFISEITNGTIALTWEIGA